MKHLLLLIAFMASSFVGFAQMGTSNMGCTNGFLVEISHERNWGYNKPIVSSVTPLSLAAQAGLQQNDIIEKIDGIETKGRSLEEIETLLNDRESFTLIVSNLNEFWKELTIRKECRPINAISEMDLAGAHAFYSLEDIQKRAFICPFKTNVADNVDFLPYISFGFVGTEVDRQEMDVKLNKKIREVMEGKGLAYTDTDPDILISTYYSYRKNPNYRPTPFTERYPYESRYNMNTKEMQYVPLFGKDIASDNAEYLLTLGIRMYDPQKSGGDTALVIWECEANEMLRFNYGTEKYAEMNIPLMLMQYPYPKTKADARFYYGTYNYNYTGINYDVNDRSRVAYVDPESPAAKAGIQAGDKINKINGIKTEPVTAKADERYMQFIYSSETLRDPGTLFTNSYGFERCMYWNPMMNVDINSLFKNKAFQATFSYLFYFRSYVNISETNIIEFEVKGKKKIKIKPEIKSGYVFETSK